MRDRYSLVVGLIFLAVIVVATLNTIEGGGGGQTLGLDQLPPRWPLPEFAVPAAASQLEGDANVAQDDCETAAVPCPDDSQRTPACQIETAGAIRICDLFDRPLVISFWFSKGDGCVNQQDVVQRVFQRYRGRVRFLSLDIRDDRDTLRELVRQHGWAMPVGYDRDGAVGSLYGVGGCPTFAYVYPGGTLQNATIGDLSVAELSHEVDLLLEATARSDWGNPRMRSDERRTKRGKDAGRPNSSAIWPTEDTAPRSVRRRQARAGVSPVAPRAEAS